MSRKEERARLNALLESLPLFGLNRYEKLKIVTALLDGGYRYNPTVLREAADAYESGKLRLYAAPHWLRRRATTMEDLLP